MPPSRFNQTTPAPPAPTVKRTRKRAAVVAEAEPSEPLVVVNDEVKIAEPDTPHMVVEVFNFRCWEGTHQWIIPLHRGLVALHGPSGRGKSSILSAINWVVSGKIAVNSCSWGKKKMTATIRWVPEHPTLMNGFVGMYRCNTPRQFQLIFVDPTRNCHGAEAEAWLAQQVGISFPLIGQLAILSQKLMGPHVHLMQLPQADKSIFLQQLFVPDEQHKDMVSSLRAHCKLCVQRAQVQLTTVNAEMATMQKMIAEVKVNESVTIDTQITPQLRLQQLHAHRTSWQAQQQRELQYKTSLEHLQQMFESHPFTDYARGLLIPFTEWVADWFAPTVSDEVAQLVQDCLAIAEEQQHTANLIEQRKLVQEETQSRQTDLKRNKDALEMLLQGWNEEENGLKVVELEQARRQLTTVQQARRALEQHQSQHGSREQMELKMGQLRRKALALTCPACHTAIQYNVVSGAWEQQTTTDHQHGGMSTDQLSEQAKAMKDKELWDAVVAERLRLELTFTPLKDVNQEELKTIIVQLSDQTRINELHTRSIQSAQAAVSNAQRVYDSPSSSFVKRAMELPTDNALPEKEWGKEHAQVALMYESLSRELQRLNTPPVRTVIVDQWTSELDSEIELMNVIITESKLRVQLTEWKARLTEMQASAAEAQAKLEAAHTLERLSREAELQTLQQHLVPLNALLQQLLDDVLFQDGGEMQCRFEVQMGATRAEVGMVLYQRGQVCDERSLSGGEYDRLALAVSLTLYRLFSVKLGILCLDESLSSLDMELTHAILMKLHDNRTLLPGIVVMVDHHGGTGMYDATVEL